MLSLGLTLFLMTSVYLTAAYFYQTLVEGTPWRLLKSDIWDHPEPDPEIWSTITALPVAGTLFLWSAFTQQYAWSLKGLGFLTLWMYSCAFTAHFTLNIRVFEVTASFVVFNALYTFFVYIQLIKCRLCGVLSTFRGLITGLTVMGVVAVTTQLPKYFGDRGGVLTLFYLQTPLVCVASFMTVLVSELIPEIHMKRLKRSTTYLLVAMMVAMVEILYVEDYRTFRGFPVHHIIVHVLEQIGIYDYCVSVAVIHYYLVAPRNFQITKAYGLIPILTFEKTA